MNIKVSIPVEIGGYTGQRDAWESFTRDHVVSLEDDGRVKLEGPAFYSRKTVWFDLQELEEAVAFLKSKEG